MLEAFALYHKNSGLTIAWSEKISDDIIYNLTVKQF